MDPTLKFIIFSLVSAAAIAGGRSLRKHGLVGEHVSRHVHLFTVVCLWSPISLVAFWGLTIDRQLVAIMAIQPFVMVGAWLLTALASRLAKLPRGDTGVVILCAVLSNQGFTLGAYLCYVLLEPGQAAMGYAIAFVTSMQVFMVLIFYPVARHYELADRTVAGPTPSLVRLIVGSFIDIRAMPLYAAAGGALISLYGPAYPAWLTRHPWLLDTAFFVGAVGSYSGIGLRLRFGDSLKHLRHHLVLAAIKFLAMPLMTVGLLLAVKHWVQPIGTLPTTVIVMSSFTPTAINSVIVPNLFHLNARLASVLWLTNTVIYLVVVLPIIIAVV